MMKNYTFDKRYSGFEIDRYQIDTYIVHMYIGDKTNHQF